MATMPRYRVLTEESKEKLGKMISKARQAKRFTQFSLALKIHASPDAIKKWEYGYNAPTQLFYKDALRRILGIDIDRLIEEGILKMERDGGEVRLPPAKKKK